MSEVTSLVGDHIRLWRQRRRLSQLELALEAEISTRHLSFVETGRAAPSRGMILTLSEALKIPLREQNVILMAGGFAPMFSERPLDAPELSSARAAIDIVLQSHLPYPAFAVDRRWRIVASNRALPQIYEAVAPEILRPPVNALRLSLHPNGMAPCILNLDEWRAHIFARLREQISVSADPSLSELYAELRLYGGRHGHDPMIGTDPRTSTVVPFRVTSPAGPLAFFTTTMVFGTPLDITLSELAVEFFFPADPETIARVASLANQTITAKSELMTFDVID
jgi:transcriptional regulator with XRE-family HTH domain